MLELNEETEATRRFILIEQGNTDKGDHYAKTLTAERVKRVITGQWAEGERKGLPGGFRFVELRREKIDADAVNSFIALGAVDPNTGKPDVQRFTTTSVPSDKVVDAELVMDFAADDTMGYGVPGQGMEGLARMLVKRPGTKTTPHVAAPSRAGQGRDGALLSQVPT